MKPEEILLLSCVSVRGAKKTKSEGTKQDKFQKKRFSVSRHIQPLALLKYEWPLPFVLFLCYLTPGQIRSVPQCD